MTLSSLKMRNAFRSSDPPLIQVDTTFELEAARYKVMAAVYLNPTTNKSELAFLALMCDETNETVEFALKAFKKICLRFTLIFMVDKDFGQILVLNSVFPGSRILLCNFHAIKFMRTLIASAPIVVETKTEILTQFKKVLYANTEDMFKVEDKKFVKICGAITVKTGKNQSSLAEYYIRNWRQCKEMWVKYYRKSLSCLGDNTSNRVERYFWTLKKAFQDTFLSLPNTLTAAVHLVKFSDERLGERYSFATNKTVIINDKDPKIRKLNVAASKCLNDRGCTIFHAAQKRLEEVGDNLEISGDEVIQHFGDKSRLYSTTVIACNCSFASTHQSPCVHILYLRRESNDEVFSQELFHVRYHRTSDDFETPAAGEDMTEEFVDEREVQDDELEDNNNVPEVLVLNDKQKYARVMPVLLRLGNLISCHPTKKFLQYMDALNELEGRVRKGQNFMLQIQKIIAEADDDDDNEEGGDAREGESMVVMA